MDPPRGYVLTVRTYWTWVHGDARGSVDDEHKVYGTPRLGHDESREGRECKRMRDGLMVIDEAMQRAHSKKLPRPTRPSETGRPRQRRLGER